VEDQRRYKRFVSVGMKEEEKRDVVENYHFNHSMGL
jgi:hypothetical protein